MKKSAILLAAMTILSQGCASIRQNNFGEFPSDRPGVTDALRGGQTLIPGFAGSRRAGQLPSSLPVPIEANPVARVNMPEYPGHKAVAGYNAASSIYQFLTCFGLHYWSGCEAEAERNFRVAVPPPATLKGPVILK
jgi:hypothetical protein